MCNQTCKKSWKIWKIGKKKKKKVFNSVVWNKHNYISEYLAHGFNTFSWKRLLFVMSLSLILNRHCTDPNLPRSWLISVSLCHQTCNIFHWGCFRSCSNGHFDYIQFFWDLENLNNLTKYDLQYYKSLE